VELSEHYLDTSVLYAISERESVSASDKDLKSCKASPYENLFL